MLIVKILDITVFETYKIDMIYSWQQERTDAFPWIYGNMWHNQILQSI